jgi:hypothetical protein
MDDLSWFKSTLMHNIRILTSEWLSSFNLIANWSHLLVLTVKAIIVFHAIHVYLPYKFKVVAIYFKTLFNHHNPLKVYVPIVGTSFEVLLYHDIFMQRVSSNPQMSIRKNVIIKNHKWISSIIVMNDKTWDFMICICRRSHLIFYNKSCKITQQYLFKDQYAIQTTYKRLRTNGSHLW